MAKYKKIRVLGITGGVGAGKSTVLAYLERAYGARVILCDEVAKLLQEPGQICYQEMLELFGRDVLQTDGRFNRQKLAEKVFADPVLLEKLNQIVHPAVKQYVKSEIQTAVEGASASQNLPKSDGRGGQPSLLVIEAALLLEDHYEELCDEIWYIDTRAEVRKERLKLSRGYSQERIAQMMANQKSDDFFRKHCQFTVDNSSDSVENTYEQIDKGLKEHGFL